MRLVTAGVEWETRSEELDRAFAGWQRQFAHVEDERGLLDLGRVRRVGKLYKLGAGSTDARFFVRIRTVDGERVALCLAGMGHGREYDAAHDAEGLRRLEERDASISDHDLRRALQEHGRPSERTVVARPTALLRPWLRPVADLRFTFDPEPGVTEDAAFRDLAAALDEAEREDLLSQVRAALSGNEPGANPMPHDCLLELRGDGSVHLAGPRNDGEHPSVVRRYDRRLLEEHRGRSWLALARDAATDRDPCLALDQAELRALTAAGDTLPLLIDGPAGSGKSTILSYLAAHLLYQRSRDGSPDVEPDEDGSPGPVLLLSASEELTEESRQRVRRNLEVRFSFSPHEAERLARRSCWTIDRLFRHLAGGTEFPPGEKATFARFAEWCATRPEILPGVDERSLWWMARAIVRGWRPTSAADDEWARDLLAELPREVLTHVEERLGRAPRADDLRRISKAFQQFLEDPATPAAWDDADLAIAAYSGLTTREVPVVAVLVDEAQDLSRLQLDVITALLEQVAFDLSDGDMLPLVFAADPHQEIIGSGFTWGRFRGLLGSVLEQHLGDAQVPDPLVLDLNHRSQRHIVAVANTVMELRGVVTSQQSARPDAGVPVHVLSHEQHAELVSGALGSGHVLLPVVQVELRKPVERDGRIVFAPGRATRDYLEQNPWIGAALRGREWVFTQTAVTAKGRSFPVVVAAGWSEIVQAGDPQEQAALYVTATRAEEGLLFVEEREEQAAALRRRLRLTDEPPPQTLLESLRARQDNLAMARQELRAGLGADDVESLRAAAAYMWDGGDQSAAAAIESIADAIEDDRPITPSSLDSLQGAFAEEVVRWAVRTGRARGFLDGYPPLPVAAPLAALDEADPEVFLRAVTDHGWEGPEDLRLRVEEHLVRLVIDWGAERSGLGEQRWREVVSLLDRCRHDLVERASAWACFHAGDAADALEWAELCGSEVLDQVKAAATDIRFIPPDLITRDAVGDDATLALLTRTFLTERPGAIAEALRDLDRLQKNDREELVDAIVESAAHRAAQLSERQARQTAEDLLAWTR